MKYLILGGAKSGKSKFAENLAFNLYKEKIKNINNIKLFYIATYINNSKYIFDKDMNKKIAIHKYRRNKIWCNIEEPFYISKFLKKLNKQSIVLIDCLTIWISNLIYKKFNIKQEFEDLYYYINTSKQNIILVSNEIGMGTVPDTKISRDFRDFQGELNQLIVKAVDKVALIFTNLPIWLK